ncbi:MAG: S8 family serine peptidase [candidate division Zixibacteria bacterium]|nr:S8 family serine peptidase [candidate division Zixibacteria bacterium]
MNRIMITLIYMLGQCFALTASASDLKILEFPNGAKYISNRVVVVNKYDAPSYATNNYEAGFAQTGVESIDRICPGLGIIQVESFYPGVLRKPALIREISRIYIFILDETTAAQTVALELADNPNIESAELQFIPELYYTPDDPYVDQQWYLAHTHTLEAWDIVRGDTTRSSIVGVVDVGVDYNHADISPNLWINELEDINDNGILDPADNNNIDDDDNGIVDDVIGWDFADEDYNPISNNPHGTGVAGCISEATDNGLMGAGIGFSARLMILKAITDNGQLVEGYMPMIYAADNGARIMNCSWGIPIFRAYEQIIIDAVWEEDVLIVAAGGDGDQVVYPAGYEHVMAVSATDEYDHKASFAPYGEYVDICAPGVNLPIPWDDDFDMVSGTSFSAGFVSGLAALLRAWYPAFTNDEIEQLIEDSADPIDHLNPGFEGLLGAGRINSLTCLMTDIDESSSIPNSFRLFQNYPNPFNASTEIRYNLSQPGRIELAIFDLMGGKIAVLVDEIQSAGNYSLTWDASDYSSGVYFGQLKTSGQYSTSKMILLK